MKFYYWIIVIVCAIFSAFFSCADMVYSIVDKDKLEKEEKKTKLAKLALDISNDYELSISAILFGNNVVNILASSIVTLIGIALNPNIGSSIATAILTVFIIIFCEFLPKVIAKRFSYSLSLIFAYPVKIIQYIFIIFVYPISKFFKLLGKAFQKRSKEEDKIDEDVLTEMVDSMEEDDILEENEAEIVRSAIDLIDIEAHEIMTPRVDMFAIDIDDNLSEVIKNENFFIHSRIPVYKETIDNIVGVLYVKNIAELVFSGENNIDITKLMTEPIFIPRNRQVLDLLNEFKNNKKHVAIVKDEYGGTEGIVTMEDILEEIVGDIFDETDEGNDEFIDNHCGEYILDGQMNLEDAMELIGYNGEIDTDYTTIGGFCQEILDRFAKTGDEFDFNQFHFVIIEATKYSVEKLKIIDTKFGEQEE